MGPPESQNYKSAFRHMNEDKYFPTKEDETSGGNKQKLSNNIVVTCIYKNVWKNRGLAYDGEVFQRRYFNQENEEGLQVPCELLSRQIVDGMDYYTALMLDGEIPSEQTHVISYIPRHVIRFRDNYYSSDTHLPNAFRHPIGIPDKMFPTAWKNLN